MIFVKLSQQFSAEFNSKMAVIFNNFTQKMKSSKKQWTMTFYVA